MEERPRNPSQPAPVPERIRALERQIAELKRQWPAHSVSPGMMQRLDELEEALETAKRE